jgi:pheromone shutdown protein TraB
MKIITSLIVAATVASTPLLANAQQTLAADAEAAAFKQLANKIPLGSRVIVQSRDGQRMTATLVAVNEDAIVVKRESRVPEPAVSIPLAQLTRLQLDEKSGFSVGKALGVGLAAGVGAILTMFAIAVSIDD